MAVPPLAGVSGAGDGGRAAQGADWRCGEDWREGCERAAGDSTVGAKSLKASILKYDQWGWHGGTANPSVRTLSTFG